MSLDILATNGQSALIRHCPRVWDEVGPDYQHNQLAQYLEVLVERPVDFMVQVDRVKHRWASAPSTVYVERERSIAGTMLSMANILYERESQPAALAGVLNKFIRGTSMFLGHVKRYESLPNETQQQCGNSLIGAINQYLTQWSGQILPSFQRIYQPDVAMNDPMMHAEIELIAKEYHAIQPSMPPEFNWRCAQMHIFYDTIALHTGHSMKLPMSKFVLSAADFEHVSRISKNDYLPAKT